MEIRPYQDADEAAVITLWTSVLHDPAPHNDPALSIRTKRAFEHDLFFVAENEAGVVGTIMAGYDGHRGWIYSVAADPDHRRQGIGSALLRHVETLLQERGCLKVNLQVRESNSGVIAFYEKLGYRIDPVVSLGKRLY